MLVDMTKQQSQGSGSKKVIEGKGLLRFIGYVEVGKHKTYFQGQESIKDKVHLIFEVFGKNYPLDDFGNPMRITVKENYSLSDKANFKKIFMMMRNGDSQIKNITQLLGKGFIANIYKYEIEGKEYPTLKGKDGYKIGPDFVEDPETGEKRNVNIPEPIGQIKKFLWDYPSKDDWDNLYIDGSYADGNSKNVIQNLIKSAVNYKGSQVQAIAEGAIFEVKEIEFKEEPKIEERKSFNPTRRFSRTTQKPEPEHDDINF